MASGDDALVHVSQRLDALAADDEHAYLYFSRVLTPADSLRPSSSAASPSLPRARAATVTTRRRRRRKQLLGLSPHSLRHVALLGASYLVSAYSLSAAAVVSPATPAPLRLPSPNSSPLLQYELASLAAGAAIGALLVGSLSDHYGRRRLLLSAAGGALLSQVVSGLVWSPYALLSARACIGVGVGGQLVLLPIVLAEGSAQRRRGRTVVLALTGLAIGALAAVHSAERLLRALRWPLLSSAALGGAQLLSLLLLALWLPDSPRFLAAVGRVDAAMDIVHATERAHGITRNARVTMPTSLFEPPPPSHDAAVADRRSRASRRRGSLSVGDGGTSITAAAAAPPLRHRRPSSALTPGMVSLPASLAKRWRRVLCGPPYARRSAGLAALWLLLGAVVSATLALVARFGTSSSPSSPSASMGEGEILLTCAGGAAAVGLLLCAALIDGTGRVPLVATSMLTTAVAAAAVGVLLLLDLPSLPLLSVACALVALGGSVAVATATVWTVELYGVLLRGTGLGLAFTMGCLGVGAAQWGTWSAPLTGDVLAPWVAWGGAGLLILGALLTLCVGDETRGREDVDSVIDHVRLPSAPSEAERESSEKLPPLHHPRSTYHSKEPPSFHDGPSGPHGDSDLASFPPPASSSSAASTYVGSSMSRSSSSAARHSSSVGFSQAGRRTSSGAGSRGTRGSSLTRSFPSPSIPPSSRYSMAATYRRRELSGGGLPPRSLSARGELSSSSVYAGRVDHTPSFIIRRSSLSRGSPRGGGGEFSPVRRASRASMGRVTYAGLTQTLPGRLDPHSVRERLSRRSSSSSSSSSDGLGDHDVMTIDIDPFESGRFVPMLG